MTAQRAHRLRLVRPGLYKHWCPACDAAHEIEIGARGAHGHKVGFDGDLVSPSFEPEMIVLDGARVCSYVLRGGVLYFLNNCTHALVGQSVPLPAYPPA